MNNKLIAVALVALMLLVFPASAAIQATSVEVRGEVSENSTGTNNNVTVGTWTANNFAGFWYDLKNDLKSETLTILNATDNTTSPYLGGTDRTIASNELNYTAVVVYKEYKVSEKELKKVKDGLNSAGTVESINGTHYAVVGWQAEKYIALKGDAKKLVKQVLEQGSTDKKTLTIGETWDLGEGWTLAAQSIDAKASPRQAWLVLSKDGVKLEDEVISQGAVFTYRKDTAGKSDAPLFVTYVDSVFAGATTDMVQLKYTWVVSTSVTEIKSGDTFGNMEVTSAGTSALTLKNKDKELTLDKDSTVDIMGDLKLKVADSDILRFYPMIERASPGTYEVRGTVQNGTIVTPSWDATSFAGFWYDLKDNKKSETLSIAATLSSGQRVISGSPTAELNYTTVVQYIQYKVNEKETGKYIKDGQDGESSTTSNNGTHYAVVGWQAQKYIALKGDAKKLVKQVLEQGSTDKKTLTIGETWDLGDGWILAAQSIDAKASPRQAWLVLSKDGVKLEDEVVSQGEVFTYRKDIAGKSDAPLFVTYVDSVFAGATTDMVQLKYTWVVSTSVTEIKSGDTFGNMEVTSAGSSAITLKNKDKELTLDSDSTVDIMGDMKFKVADASSVLRFYPMVEYEILGDGEEPAAVETTVAPEDAAPEDAAPEDAAPEDAAPEDAAPEDAAPEDAAPEDAADEEPETPGFEAVFAIAGLLAVSFLVLRQRK